MKKQVIVCDFCQGEGMDKVATKCCCICGKDYCAEHARCIDVTVGAYIVGGSLAVRGALEVCPDCHDLLAFDNWTTGEMSTRAPRFDRPILKAVLPSAIEAVKQSLQETRHSIGPGDVKGWIGEKRGE